MEYLTSETDRTDKTEEEKDWGREHSGTKYRYKEHRER